MSILVQSASLYDGQEVFVWSDCPLDLDTDFLVGNMVFLIWSKSEYGFRTSSTATGNLPFGSINFSFFFVLLKLNLTCVVSSES